MRFVVVLKIKHLWLLEWIYLLIVRHNMVTIKQLDISFSQFANWNFLIFILVPITSCSSATASKQPAIAAALGRHSNRTQIVVGRQHLSRALSIWDIKHGHLCQRSASTCRLIALNHSAFRFLLTLFQPFAFLFVVYQSDLVN